MTTRDRDQAGPEARAARLVEMLEAHEAYRGSCLNLVAAENVLSPLARGTLDSELVHRYADYVGRDLRARKYLGTGWIVEIEESVHDLLRALFRVPFVETRALSGHVAGAAVLMSLTKPGDIVLELDGPGGGHRIAEKLNATHFATLDVRPLPFDPERYGVDVERTVELARRVRPRVIILGSSLFLFPHPVAELAAALADQPETVIAYDASHVLGLIAGGAFQDPLREGAAVLWSSTHKSFPGPPGGLILAERAEIIDAASQAVYPGLVTNHHPARMPALGIAAAEMLAFGQAYAGAIIANARRLAAEIDARGVPVVGAARGYTASHTALVVVDRFRPAPEIGARLEAAGIITTVSKLPAALGGSCIRLGLQELTRRGALPDDMPAVAGLIADVVTGTRNPEAVLPEVRALAARFAEVGYTFRD